MRRISEHVYAEMYLCGCNPGFFTTRGGAFMVGTPRQTVASGV